MGNLTTRDWRLGRTVRQRARRQAANTEFREAWGFSERGRKSRIRGVFGVGIAFLLFFFWLHAGHLVESSFFAVTLGLTLSGAVVPRRSDSPDAVQAKLAATSACLTGAVVMLFTLSLLASIVQGLFFGLMAAGLYQLIKNVDSAGEHAHARIGQDDGEPRPE